MGFSKETLIFFSARMSDKNGGIMGSNGDILRIIRVNDGECKDNYPRRRPKFSSR